MTGPTHPDRCDRRSGDAPSAGIAALALAWAALLVACGGNGDAGPPLGPVVALESPAGPGASVPHLASGPDDVVMSWLEPSEAGAHALRVAELRGTTWGAVGTVATSDGFFVNWADFPSVIPVEGRLVAHWLARGAEGGYDYGIRVSFSEDGGRTWSEPWVPHDDGTPTEHGFVSMMAVDGGVGLVWLDGRDFARPETKGAASDPASPEMALRYRWTSLDGQAGEEIPIDTRVCDCCQTDAVVTDRGVLVVYRDRSAEEIRDISAIRLVAGSWTDGEPVGADGWEIAACPVNGPAADAAGTRAVVAWFTGAGDRPRVNVAFSTDAGATFGPPIRVDGGEPFGRVDAVLLADGSALVSWLERGPSAAEIRVRRVEPTGIVGPPMTVAVSSESRASGFPQMVRHGGHVVFAWTDPGNPSVVRVARAELTG